MISVSTSWMKTRAPERSKATDTSFWFRFKDDVVIRVRAADAGRSSATVRYEYTGLDANGLVLVDEYTSGKHEERVAGWARAVNHYLETGTRLEAPHD